MFQTSPFFGVEAIAGLIPIHLHFCKLSGRAQLRAHSLSHNHILHSLLESRSVNSHDSHCLSLDLLFCCQREIIKGPIIDMDNRFNKVFPLFDHLNKEFSPDSCIIDIFPSYFSFHPCNKYSDDNLKAHSWQLDNIAITSSLDQSHALIVTDAGIKNNMATSIAHIYIHNKSIIKMLHHAVNIISTEAELFAIRCDINQAVNIPGISKIVVITDFVHVAKRIFDSSLHLFQIHSVSISKEFRKFFLLSTNNSITFWECPSWCNWSLYKLVDRETKQLYQTPLFPCKSSWDFSKKSKCDNIVQN